MLEIITLNLGPILGFLGTIATVVFIAWAAPRTHREGALEALRAGVYQADGGVSETAPGSPGAGVVEPPVVAAESPEANASRPDQG